MFATLSMIHDHGLSLDWQAPPGLVLPRDREDLLELLGNLLDNACKWADQRVQLTVEESAEGYRLSVDDDGPGIDAERREAVLGRGTRLDEQVAGHGLGLGIVRDIIEAWHGRIELQDSPLGGLRVVVSLPRRRTKVRRAIAGELRGAISSLALAGAVFSAANPPYESLTSRWQRPGCRS